VQSGINKYDPVHGSVFEVYFSLPEQIAKDFKETEAILTEQVTNVSGLDALQKTTEAGTQKFLGVDASYLNPTMSSTTADVTMTFNLNLKNVTDNFVLKVFMAWRNLSYNMADGTRGIKTDYISDAIRISEANRNGQIWRAFIFHNIMITSITGLADLDYTQNEAKKLNVTFRTDYWDDDMA
jgi:hypothetical protein